MLTLERAVAAIASWMSDMIVVAELWRRIRRADDVGEVVVDALAEEEHRFPPAVDAAKPVGNLAQRRQRRTRFEHALLLIRIVDAAREARIASA